MEKEEKNERAASMMMKPPETEFFLQWGNRKRLRCVRIRSNTSPPHHLSSSASDLSSTTTRIRRKITSRFPSVSSHNDEKQLSFPQPPSRLTRYTFIITQHPQWSSDELEGVKKGELFIVNIEIWSLGKTKA